MNELRNVLMELATRQRDLIQNGQATTKEIADQRIIEGELSDGSVD
jgi:hypothetical protein